MSSFSVTDQRRPRFAMVTDPALLLCRDPYELATYTWLVRYGCRNGESNPSHETLATRVGVSKRKLAGVLSRLKQAGLIDWEKQYVSTPNGTRQTSNRYQLLDCSHLVAVDAITATADEIEIARGANSTGKSAGLVAPDAIIRSAPRADELDTELNVVTKATRDTQDPSGSRASLRSSKNTRMSAEETSAYLKEVYG